MKTGCLPYIEDVDEGQCDLQSLLYEDPAQFWSSYCEIALVDEIFASSFKELFEMMTKKDHLSRATLKDVKDSAWFKGEIYSKNEFKEIIDDLFD